MFQRDNEISFFSVTISENLEDKDEQIFELLRTLKTLKDALLKEREAKTSLENELAELKKRADSYELSLRVKVRLLFIELLKL